MLVRTNAIVISTVKYGDSSLITRCYCKELGLKSFMLKGILTSKKGGLKKSLFQPLNASLDLTSTIALSTLTHSETRA